MILNRICSLYQYRHDITEVLLKVALNTSKQTNMKHMTTSVSLILNILCIKFKISTQPSYNNATRSVYIRVDIIVTCGKHIPARILSLRLVRVEVCVLKTSLLTRACYDFFYPSTNSKNHKEGMSNVKFLYNTFSKQFCIGVLT